MLCDCQLTPNRRALNEDGSVLESRLSLAFAWLTKKRSSVPIMSTALDEFKNHES